MGRVEWVFAYGSIMFRRGFPVVEERTALLRGLRRVFGQPSVRNWGTKTCPAPTASLVEGGDTAGLALRPAPTAAETVDLLIAREASQPEVVTVETTRGPVRALVWRMEALWADWDIPRLVEAGVANVVGGGGPHGNAWDYVDGMMQAMVGYGMVDPLVASYHRALAAALADRAPEVRE